MAKRARGATRRPGQRRAIQRSGARPAGPASTAAAAQPGLDENLAPALEPRTEPKVEPTRSASAAVRTRSGRASSAFVAEAAQEYAYVVSDVRRIVIVASGIIGIMVVLFVLIDVLGIVRI
jgi:hypothetical protein